MTTQREIAERLGLPIHPPKVEIFDLEHRTNTDSKSRVRHVDEYRVEPFGLFMARPMADHPRATYVESWLLPDLGIRVTDWEWKPGAGRDQDFYLDIVDVERGSKQWRSVDYYLDITVRAGRGAEVLDIDEFLVAARADLLDPATAQRALEITYATTDGLARHDYDLARWLGDKGIELRWNRTGTGYRQYGDNG